MWVAALPVALVYDIGMWLTGSRPTVPPPETIGISLPGGLIAVIGWIVAWPAWVLTKLVIAPALASSQRKYEYEADAAAAAVGLGEPLAAALRVMGAFEAGRSGWERAITATHPPTELRIEALQPALNRPGKVGDSYVRTEETNGTRKREPHEAAEGALSGGDPGAIDQDGVRAPARVPE